MYADIYQGVLFSNESFNILNPNERFNGLNSDGDMDLKNILFNNIAATENAELLNLILFELANEPDVVEDPTVVTVRNSKKNRMNSVITALRDVDSDVSKLKETVTGFLKLKPLPEDKLNIVAKRLFAENQYKKVKIKLQEKKNKIDESQESLLKDLTKIKDKITEEKENAEESIAEIQRRQQAFSYIFRSAKTTQQDVEAIKALEVKLDQLQKDEVAQSDKIKAFEKIYKLIDVFFKLPERAKIISTMSPLNSMAEVELILNQMDQTIEALSQPGQADLVSLRDNYYKLLGLFGYRRPEEEEKKQLGEQRQAKANAIQGNLAEAKNKNVALFQEIMLDLKKDPRLAEFEFNASSIDSLIADLTFNGKNDKVYKFIQILFGSNAVAQISKNLINESIITNPDLKELPPAVLSGKIKKAKQALVKDKKFEAVLYEIASEKMPNKAEKKVNIATPAVAAAAAPIEVGKPDEEEKKSEVVSDVLLSSQPQTPRPIIPPVATSVVSATASAATVTKKKKDSIHLPAEWKKYKSDKADVKDKIVAVLHNLFGASSQSMSKIWNRVWDERLKYLKYNHNEFGGNDVDKEFKEFLILEAVAARMLFLCGAYEARKSSKDKISAESYACEVAVTDVVKKYNANGPSVIPELETIWNKYVSVINPMKPGDERITPEYIEQGLVVDRDMHDVEIYNSFKAYKSMQPIQNVVVGGSVAPQVDLQSGGAPAATREQRSASQSGFDLSRQDTNKAKNIDPDFVPEQTRTGVNNSDVHLDLSLDESKEHQSPVLSQVPPLPVSTSAEAEVNTRARSSVKADDHKKLATSQEAAAAVQHADSSLDELGSQASNAEVEVKRIPAADSKERSAGTPTEEAKAASIDQHADLPKDSDSSQPLDQVIAQTSVAAAPQVAKVVSSVVNRLSELDKDLDEMDWSKNVTSQNKKIRHSIKVIINDEINYIDNDIKKTIRKEFEDKWNARLEKIKLGDSILAGSGLPISNNLRLKDEFKSFQRLVFVAVRLRMMAADPLLIGSASPTGTALENEKRKECLEEINKVLSLYWSTGFVALYHLENLWKEYMPYLQTRSSDTYMFDAFEEYYNTGAVSDKDRENIDIYDAIEQYKLMIAAAELSSKTNEASLAGDSHSVVEFKENGVKQQPAKQPSAGSKLQTQAERLYQAINVLHNKVVEVNDQVDVNSESLVLYYANGLDNYGFDLLANIKKGAVISDDHLKLIIDIYNQAAEALEEAKPNAKMNGATQKLKQLSISLNKMPVYKSMAAALSTYISALDKTIQLVKEKAQKAVATPSVSDQAPNEALLEEGEVKVEFPDEFKMDEAYFAVNLEAPTVVSTFPQLAKLFADYPFVADVLSQALKGKTQDDVNQFNNKMAFSQQFPKLIKKIDKLNTKRIDGNKPEEIRQGFEKALDNINMNAYEKRIIFNAIFSEMVANKVLREIRKEIQPLLEQDLANQEKEMAVIFGLVKERIQANLKVNSIEDELNKNAVELIKEYILKTTPEEREADADSYALRQAGGLHVVIPPPSPNDRDAELLAVMPNTLGNSAAEALGRNVPSSFAAMMAQSGPSVVPKVNSAVIAEAKNKMEVLQKLAGFITIDVVSEEGRQQFARNLLVFDAAIAPRKLDESKEEHKDAGGLSRVFNEIVKINPALNEHFKALFLNKFDLKFIDLSDNPELADNPQPASGFPAYLDTKQNLDPQNKIALFEEDGSFSPVVKAYLPEGHEQLLRIIKEFFAISAGLTYTRDKDLHNTNTGKLRNWIVDLFGQTKEDPTQSRLHTAIAQFGVDPVRIQMQSGLAQSLPMLDTGRPEIDAIAIMATSIMTSQFNAHSIIQNDLQQLENQLKVMPLSALENKANNVVSAARQLAKSLLLDNPTMSLEGLHKALQVTSQLVNNPYDANALRELGELIAAFSQAKSAFQFRPVMESLFVFSEAAQDAIDEKNEEKYNEPEQAEVLQQQKILSVDLNLIDEDPESQPIAGIISIISPKPYLWQNGMEHGNKAVASPVQEHKSGNFISRYPWYEVSLDKHNFEAQRNAQMKWLGISLLDADGFSASPASSVASSPASSIASSVSSNSSRGNSSRSVSPTASTSVSGNSSASQSPRSILGTDPAPQPRKYNKAVTAVLGYMADSARYFDHDRSIRDSLRFFPESKMGITWSAENQPQGFVDAGIPKSNIQAIQLTLRQFEEPEFIAEIDDVKRLAGLGVRDIPINADLQEPILEGNLRAGAKLLKDGEYALNLVKRSTDAEPIASFVEHREGDKYKIAAAKLPVNKHSQSVGGLQIPSLEYLIYADRQIQRFLGVKGSHAPMYIKPHKDPLLVEAMILLCNKHGLAYVDESGLALSDKYDVQKNAKVSAVFKYIDSKIADKSLLPKAKQMNLYALKRLMAELPEKVRKDPEVKPLLKAMKVGQTPSPELFNKLLDVTDRIVKEEEAAPPEKSFMQRLFRK
ncbi:MAG: hypothetical protein P4M14_04685 [Gammaproteobacteria bacterium]|nr:hypothetical protein [Gammaproteobacteria bacterium]